MLRDCGALPLPLHAPHEATEARSRWHPQAATQVESWVRTEGHCLEPHVPRFSLRSTLWVGRY